MKYTKDNKINNLIDVVHFFEHLIYERKVSFHPDDDFKEYVQYENGKPLFTESEVNLYNSLMNQCFEICEEQKIDIYSIGLASMRRQMVPNVDNPIETGMLTRITGKDEIFKIQQKTQDGYIILSIENKTTSIVDESQILLI